MGKSLMKSIKTIKDPQAFQLLADDTRRKIIFLLRAKEMTVSQIAADLSLTPQAVYHHIKKLLAAEMVEVSKEVRVEHLIESYYRTTAEVFFCSMGMASRSPKAAKEQLITVLGALKKIGFNIDTDEKIVAQLMEIDLKKDECCPMGKYEEKISELDDVDFNLKQAVAEYAEIMSASDEDFAKQQQLRKKTREILLSHVRK
jgi:DNA-binding transcriptional ArsR family regulator